MVSLFTGFLFASGIVPFLKDESFENILTPLGFGFVVGYISDNILAALQNLARKVFGGLNDNSPFCRRNPTAGDDLQISRRNQSSLRRQRRWFVLRPC